MKSLSEIKLFPARQRDVLQRQFGITSAESFFEHATRNAAGMELALKVTPPKLDQLKRLVEVHLTPEFVERCRQPLVKHKRGVVID
jgi:hypothetical protein